MKKVIIITSTLTVVIVIGLLLWTRDSNTLTTEMTVTENDPVFNYRNAVYYIDNRAIKFRNGEAEDINDDQTKAKITTRYFGNELVKDIDGDGRDDVVFLVTQNTGGSGTFYYVVGSLNTDAGYVGTHGVLLGDRIAPQTTESGPGRQVIVNYADRAAGEPFSTQPSVGKSLRLLFDPNTKQFGEVVNDFEGEADPARMTLGMKTWNLVSGTDATGEAIAWKDAAKFTVTFTANSFSATTDCNTAGGSYTAENGTTITFGPMMSTLMYCDGAQEADFTSALSATTQYSFTSRGELVLESQTGQPSLVFR